MPKKHVHAKKNMFTSTNIFVAGRREIPAVEQQNKFIYYPNVRIKVHWIKFNRYVYIYMTYRNVCVFV